MHRAKEYLLQYQQCKKRADRINQQIEAIKIKYALPGSPQIDDMPHARNTERDLSDYMVKLDELTGYLVSAYCKCMGIEGDILRRLDAMENREEAELLRLRYTCLTDKGKLMPWERVAEGIPCSYRQVYYMHGRALQHFPLP